MAEPSLTLEAADAHIAELEAELAEARVAARNWETIYEADGGIKALAEARAEIDALKHDIERHVAHLAERDSDWEHEVALYERREGLSLGTAVRTAKNLRRSVEAMRDGHYNDEVSDGAAADGYSDCGLDDEAERKGDG